MDTITRHHNEPPLADRLALDHADLVKRADEAAALVPTDVRAIASDEEAAAYTQTGVDIRAVLTDADAEFKREKQPFLDDGRTVDNFFRFRAKLDEAIKRLQRVTSDWQTKKLAAARKEQAEREAREREAAATFGGDAPEAAPVAAPEATRIVTSTGSMASGRVNWKYRVVDEKKVPKKYLQINDAAVTAAIAGFKARGLKIEDAKDSIAGLEIYEAVSTSFRR